MNTPADVETPSKSALEEAFEWLCVNFIHPADRPATADKYVEMIRRHISAQSDPMDVEALKVEAYRAWRSDKNTSEVTERVIWWTIDHLASRRLIGLGWMPIETAPKDGTMILICLPRMMKLIVRARYDRVHKHWLHDYEGEGGIVNPYFYHKGDLWQPLPAAPDDGGGGG